MEFRFDCGCRFKQFDIEIKECDGLPPIEIDFYNLPQCESVWPILGAGKTKGIFQLEKSLGKRWCKELYPENIHHLAALTAILRPGCISYNTEIVVSIKKDKNGKTTIIRKPIEQIFKNKRFYKEIISLDEITGKFINNKVKDIIYSGKKECFKIKISKYISRSKKFEEYYIKRNKLICTNDHKIFTSKGWKELKDIEIGDRIAFLKRKRNRFNIKDKIASRHHSEIKITNTRGIFSFSDLCNQYYEYKCVICGWDKCKLDCHHIDGNRHTNNSPENLCFLCPNHHRMYNDGNLNKNEIIEGRKKYELLNPEEIMWFRYHGKESVGIKDCYDIQMDGPNHNFIAGNVVVHNCIESIIDDKSLTGHYCDTKNKRQEPRVIHPALETILNDTYQCLIYQEQVLLIAKEIAGFNGGQADILRKGIGHKDPKILFEMEKQFLDGCEAVGKISLDDAKMIFDIIKKSNRYLFNASHSYEYGTISYWTGYAKAHFPLHFYASYLAFAKDKQDPKQEIKEIIDDARSEFVNIVPPHISSLKNNRTGDVCIQDQQILFGIIDIKGIGAKQIENVYTSVLEKEKEIGKDITRWSWYDFLFNIKASSTVINNLILVGATPGGQPRKQKSYEYSVFNNLTEREIPWVRDNYKNFETLGKCLEKFSTIEKKSGGPATVKRKDLIADLAKGLNNSPFSIKDHPDWIVANERELLGVPITYSSTENKNISTNMNCADFLAGKRGKIEILVEINSFREHIIKNGENSGLPMCMLDLKDSTGNISAVLFSEAYKENQECIFEGNVVIVKGFRGKKEPNSLIVSSMLQV